jgi:hypothetical protein
VIISTRSSWLPSWEYSSLSAPLNFNFDFSFIESSVEDLPGHYFGVGTEALYTGQEDYLSIFNHLPECRKWVELGSGVGLGPLLFAGERSHATSIGVEFDKARHQAAIDAQKAQQILNVTFLNDDLMTCSLPVGDVYFLYFPTGPVLDRILSELGSMAHDFKLVAIESHGDLLPRLALESWLIPIDEVPLQSQRHYPFARIYQRRGERSELFNDLSFQERYLVIDEPDGRRWLGDSLQMEWQEHDHFLLKFPPRSIFKNSVHRVLLESDLAPEERLLVQLRQRGAVTIRTLNRTLDGEIRKIMLKPSFGVELSTGELVEWSQIKQILQRDILCFESSSQFSF